MGQKPGREAQAQAARVQVEEAKLRVRGQVVELRGPRVRKDGRRKARARAKRGVIREFSIPSRRRLFRFIMGLPWGTKLEVAGRKGARAGGQMFEVGLTWPGKAELVPRSGPGVQAALNAFECRLKRLFDGEVCFVWKREFQRRGAPELALAVWARVVPKRWQVSWPGLRVEHEGFLVLLREWVARAWYEICGCGDPDHLKAGTTVKRMYGRPEAIARYFAKYVTKKGSKEYQNEVPEGFEQPGRFWGVCNRELWEIEVVEVPVSGLVFHGVRRVMVRYGRSKGWRLRLWSKRWQRWWGLTVYGRVFGEQLVSWVTSGG